MSLTALADTLAALCLLTGAFLSLVAAVGLVRLPDLLTRMHAVTKPQVLGMILVVLGLALRLRDPALLGLLFLVVITQMGTTTVSSHMMGRASFRAGQVREDLLVVDELSDRDAWEEPRGAP